jgi:hypothetical protein
VLKRGGATYVAAQLPRPGLRDALTESLNVHPPPLDARREGVASARRFPASPNPIRDATPAEDVLALALKSRREGARGPQQHDYDVARQRVEQAIGPSEGLRGPFGRISFKANKKGVRTLLTTWDGGPKP